MDDRDESKQHLFVDFLLSKNNSYEVQIFQNSQKGGPAKKP